MATHGTRTLKFASVPLKVTVAVDMQERPELSVTDWAVLGVLATTASHGFAAARALAADGAIGQVWTVSRPLVYRAAAKLVDAGLVVESGVAPGSGGPRRTLLSVTPAGRHALRAWLVSPVRHVRDYRSELMLKLALLEQTPDDLATLLSAQRRELEPVCDGLARRLEDAVGFEATLARWRLDNALAARHFLEELELSVTS